jgi:hypothetical protein
MDIDTDTDRGADMNTDTRQVHKQHTDKDVDMDSTDLYSIIAQIPKSSAIALKFFFSLAL